MEVDAFWGDVEALREQVDQLEEAAGLGGGEAVAVAVAYEADADGVAVEPVGVLACGVCAEVLGEPAGCCVEFAIDHAVAVADDEVIADAFEAHVAGVLVEGGGGGGAGGAVVDHDGLPAALLDGGLDGAEDGLDVGCAGGCQHRLDGERVCAEFEVLGVAQPEAARDEGDGDDECGPDREDAARVGGCFFGARGAGRARVA